MGSDSPGKASAASASSTAGVAMNSGGPPSQTDEKCKEVLASFEPPIETGSHKELRAKLNEGPDGKKFQCEHFLNNFQVQHSRGGANIPGLEGYNPSDAPCWNIFDGQKKYSEHWALTKADRDASNDLFDASKTDQPPTISDALDASELNMRDELATSERNPGKDDTERAEIAADAAECLRADVQAYLDSLNEDEKGVAKGVDPDTPIRKAREKGTERLGTLAGDATNAPAPG